MANRPAQTGRDMTLKAGAGQSERWSVFEAIVPPVAWLNARALQPLTEVAGARDEFRICRPPVTLDDGQIAPFVSGGMTCKSLKQPPGLFRRTVQMRAHNFILVLALTRVSMRASDDRSPASMSSA